MSPTPAEVHNAVQFSMGETVAILLAIVAIIIGLQTFLAYCTLEWLKRRYSDSQQRHIDQSNNIRLIEFEIEALQRFNSTIETHFAIQVGILSMFAEKVEIYSELPNLDSENKKLQDDVRKAMQEAFLGSRSERRRFAAIQELSNLVGDRDSLARMKFVADFFPNDRNFAFGIDHLRKRLDAYLG